MCMKTFFSFMAALSFPLSPDTLTAWIAVWYASTRSWFFLYRALHAAWPSVTIFSSRALGRPTYGNLGYPRWPESSLVRTSETPKTLTERTLRQNLGRPGPQGAFWREISDACLLVPGYPPPKPAGTYLVAP